MRAKRYDVVVIGAGHNSLVAATYLARAGLRVVVLEKRAVVGGMATTERFAPGFQADGALHTASMFRPQIVRDLFLRMHDFELVPVPTLRFCPFPDGSSIHLTTDPAESAASIGRLSPADRERFLRYSAEMEQFARFLEAALARRPPDPFVPEAAHRAREIAPWLAVARDLRLLGTRQMYRLLRTLPMSVYDLMSEWFEDPRVRAALGTPGIWHLHQGPRAAGTAFNLLYHSLGHRHHGLPAAGIVRGGLGRLTQALAAAARHAGVEIRLEAPVARVALQKRRATGAILASGETVPGRYVVSGVDPFHTFRELVPPFELPPTFNRKIGNIRFGGVAGRVNLALERLPTFTALADGDGHLLRGRIQIAPSLDSVERAHDAAKYGRFSRRPVLELTIPTLHDPSLAPPGKHTMSILVQYTPHALQEGRWQEMRPALGDAVVNTLAAYAPDLPELILHRQILTPVDLAQRVGAYQGHLYHGEMALDQLLFMRPVPGWGQYTSPIRDLYLCGSGAHPGGGVTGEPGRLAAAAIRRRWAEAGK